MYKKQMKFQKIICMLSIIASAVVFIYSLGVMTDLYDTLYSTMMNPYDLTQTDVPGSLVYYYMQNFNRAFLLAAIGLILISCFLFLTATHTRRKYYIGNYVAVALSLIANVAVAVWAHMDLEFYKALFLQVDFEALKKHAEMWNTYYTDSTFWFDIHYAVFALSVIVAVLLVVNAVWKSRLMKEEKALLGTEGRAAA